MRQRNEKHRKALNFAKKQLEKLRERTPTVPQLKEMILTHPELNKTRAQVNHFFGKIRESGQLSRILRAHMRPTKKANCWGKGEFRSMGLHNTIAAFGLVAVSLLVAFLIFLLELLVSRCMPRPPR